jgi:hypothetical protein
MRELRADQFREMPAEIPSVIFCLSVFCAKTTNTETYRTVIVPFVLYGCETWSIILRAGHVLTFENRVLRNICEPKREEIT